MRPGPPPPHLRRYRAGGAESQNRTWAGRVICARRIPDRGGPASFTRPLGFGGLCAFVDDMCPELNTATRDGTPMCTSGRPPPPSSSSLSPPTPSPSSGYATRPSPWRKLPPNGSVERFMSSEPAPLIEPRQSDAAPRRQQPRPSLDRRSPLIRAHGGPARGPRRHRPCCLQIATCSSSPGMTPIPGSSRPWPRPGAPLVRLSGKGPGPCTPLAGGVGSSTISRT
jgi:hypothetical protein